MKTLEKKIYVAIITAILLSSVAMAFSDSTVSAQKPIREKTTYAFCTVIPDPIGVGQTALIWVGISDYLNAETDGFEGITVTVTKPDNTTETLGPYRTDSTGSTGGSYVPNMVGTYTFQSHFPEQWYNWSTADVLYKASSSEKYTLTVQDEPIPYYSSAPLPSEYWSMPIDAQNREWNTIAGNWLWGAALNNYPYYNWRAPYNDYAPESGHILWSKPLTLGGIVGGELGEHAYDIGDAYEGYFLNSVIINGVLFYNRVQSNGGTRVEKEVVAVDLNTGKELWVRNWNNTQLSFGQLFYWDSFNVHGAYGYLWSISGSNWNAYDPTTGRWVYGFSNVPSGATPISGPNGELLIYTVNNANGWMTMWNSTLAVPWHTRSSSGQGSWIQNDMGKVFDARIGIQWNVTIPKGLPGKVLSALEDRIIGGVDDAWSTHAAILRGDYSQVFWCLSTEPGQEGRLLFNVTWTPTPQDVGSAFIGASAEEGIFIVALKATRQIVGLSLDTGKQLWGPTESQLPADMFTINNYRRGVTSIGDGKIISGGMGGRVHCYDAKTGNTLWTYDAEDPYNEILWGNNWPLYLSFVADGKIYLHSAEHSPIDPMPRGAPFICLDLETGEEIWSITLRGVHWGGYPIIGASTIAMFNAYDNRIYAIGKGPSSTTVDAPMTGVSVGSQIILRGTVTDISAGTQGEEQLARFPHGVPAVSDESMSAWMEYIYTQKSKPANVTGVTVELFVLDSNNNYRSIGVTTTDETGFYSLNWTPDISGKYTVYAKFAGTNSYWPSQATTAFTAEEAEVQPQPTESPSSTVEQYFWVAVAAIIAVIVICFIITILLLRKKE